MGLAFIPSWTLYGKPKRRTGDTMMLSLYVTLGAFLLIAVRDPSANRSRIAFTAWSSFAHGAVMAIKNASERGELRVAVSALAVIGVTLLALAPARGAAPTPSAARALCKKTLPPAAAAEGY